MFNVALNVQLTTVDLNQSFAKIKWFCSYYACVVTNAKVKCELSDQDFEITCSPEDVIEIHSAEVGFIEYWSSNTDRVPCGQTYKTICVLSPPQLHPITTKCNDSPRCHIEAEYFNSERHCPVPTDYDNEVIKVTYDCVKGKWKIIIFCIMLTFVCVILSL